MATLGNPNAPTVGEWQAEQLSSARTATSDSSPMTLAEYRAAERSATGFLTPGTKKAWNKYISEFEYFRDLNEAEKSASSARAWEEYMSSTSYQRAVKDLKAAGLNPWLAVTSLNGASTPGTSSAFTSSSNRSKSSSSSESKSFSTSALLVALLALILGKGKQ